MILLQLFEVHDADIVLSRAFPNVDRDSENNYLVSIPVLQLSLKQRTLILLVAGVLWHPYIVWGGGHSSGRTCLEETIN